MRTAGRAAVLLLLATAAAAARHHNITTAVSAFTAEDRDEEGYRYGGKFVPNFSSQPFKGKFLQFPYATCPEPYDTFSFVTKIRVCRDTDGFITGIRYFSEHPIRHHDPTTVCDAVGHEGASDCETLKLYTEDWKWRRYRTVTNIRTAKVRDGRDRWRVVYLAFSYSDGAAVEFGSYPHQHGAKIEQWFMKPEPGKICGLNGFFTVSSVCDAKSGYLQWVKPCGKCIPKPHNYKCDADYCTRTIKKKYKGGYKGDFAEDDLYKDDEGDKEKYLTKEEYSQQQYSGNGQYGQHQPEQQYGQGNYENGQYKQQQGEEYIKEQSQPEFVERSLQQPLKQSARSEQQHKQHDGKHEKHDKDHKEHKERKEHKAEKQEKQQAQPEKPSGFKWPFPKIG